MLGVNVENKRPLEGNVPAAVEHVDKKIAAGTPETTDTHLEHITTVSDASSY